ncbi:Transmembrane_domain-containing protein [Hexamita inflata]|uniref:Transmembrane_domain-containing protein n=1 Tax=Hexamita inflata TaxID=28002 RepID=A0ABP1GUI9_9EUKA
MFKQTEGEKFNTIQETKYKEFLKNVQSECGIHSEYKNAVTPMDQKQIYNENKPVMNTIYSQTPDTIFQVHPVDIPVFLELQMTELLQLLANHYKLKIKVREFGTLIKYNSLPEKCVASLELLNMLKPQLTPDEAIVILLVCMTQRIMRGAFDDQYVITMHDYFSKMFNDRSPNQRAAMACGWSIITEMNLVEQKHANLYFELMICGDTKMYERVLQETIHKQPMHLLHSLAWLLCHSPMLMRDTSYQIQKDNYKKVVTMLHRVFICPYGEYPVLADYTLDKAKGLMKQLDLLQNYHIQ